MYNTNKLQIPGTNKYLFPNCKVKLGRFESTVWVVLYGWYSWAENRPVCGWYLKDEYNPSVIKPLQLPDLDDIYFIEN